MHIHDANLVFWEVELLLVDKEKQSSERTALNMMDSESSEDVEGD